jgi:hypothetical protein
MNPTITVPNQNKIAKQQPKKNIYENNYTTDTKNNTKFQPIQTI